MTNFTSETLERARALDVTACSPATKDGMIRGRVWRRYGPHRRDRGQHRCEDPRGGLGVDELCAPVVPSCSYESGSSTSTREQGWSEVCSLAPEVTTTPRGPLYVIQHLLDRPASPRRGRLVSVLG
jgi:hypothetical protein